jgi:iron complex transport system ATP-binding protein
VFLPGATDAEKDLAMLRAVDVSFSYAKRLPRSGSVVRPILDRVSVSIDPGELVGILGPNGSGKTTLLKILGGTLRPDSGSVSLEGTPMTSWSRRDIARRIAVVPQDTRAPFDFTALDLVLMGRFPHLGAFALEGPADLAIAREALDAAGAAQFEERVFSTLSGGERQRVVIASALAQSARLLLLDEPTASLDIGHSIDVQALLGRLNADGVTMVLCTHDLALAAALCRRAILIRGGRILAAGAIDDVLNTETVRALYDVDAIVERHAGSGRLTVVPLGHG